MQAYNEYRAMSEGTTTAGGFGIPVFIDPSIIMTAQGSENPFLSHRASRSTSTPTRGRASRRPVSRGRSRLRPRRSRTTRRPWRSRS